MEGSKTLFCFSKFPWARETISSTKFTDNLGKCPRKRFASLDLQCTTDIAYATRFRHAVVFVYPTFTAEEVLNSHLSLL
jgi:hypothetical protein